MTDAGIAAGLRFEHYDWRARGRVGREAMLRFGPDEGPVVIVAPPLFEEANRTRALIVAMLRNLATHGIGGVLPDLPGQGDSLVPLESVSLIDLQKAYEAVTDTSRRCGRNAYGVCLRSGAVIDTAVRPSGRWYLSPQSGSDLMRELRRIKQASVEERIEEAWYVEPALADGAQHPPVEIAGNLVSTGLLTDLAAAPPWTPNDGGPVRIVRLIGDTGAADLHLPGPALWRRSEPEVDLDLAQALADDIAAWIERCDG